MAVSLDPAHVAVTWEGVHHENTNIGDTSGDTGVVCKVKGSSLIKGCTVPWAPNFNPAANFEDGSCSCFAHAHKAAESLARGDCVCDLGYEMNISGALCGSHGCRGGGIACTKTLPASVDERQALLMSFTTPPALQGWTSASDPCNSDLLGGWQLRNPELVGSKAVDLHMDVDLNRGQAVQQIRDSDHSKIRATRS